MIHGSDGVACRHGSVATRMAAAVAAAATASASPLDGHIRGARPMIAGSWQQQRQAVVEESLWNFVTTSSLIAATCFMSKEQLPHAISFASTPVASAETARSSGSRPPSRPCNLLQSYKYLHVEALKGCLPARCLIASSQTHREDRPLLNALAEVVQVNV